MIRGKMMSNFYVSVSSTDLQVYFIMTFLKCKENKSKFFKILKSNIMLQKMLLFHIFTKFYMILHNAQHNTTEAR